MTLINKDQSRVLIVVRCRRQEACFPRGRPRGDERGYGGWCPLPIRLSQLLPVQRVRCPVCVLHASKRPHAAVGRTRTAGRRNKGVPLGLRHVVRPSQAQERKRKRERRQARVPGVADWGSALARRRISARRRVVHNPGLLETARHARWGTATSGIVMLVRRGCTWDTAFQPAQDSDFDVHVRHCTAPVAASSTHCPNEYLDLLPASLGREVDALPTPPPTPTPTCFHRRRRRPRRFRFRLDTSGCSSCLALSLRFDVIVRGVPAAVATCRVRARGWL